MPLQVAKPPSCAANCLAEGGQVPGSKMEGCVIVCVIALGPCPLVDKKFHNSLVSTQDCPVHGRAPPCTMNTLDKPSGAYQR